MHVYAAGYKNAALRILAYGITSINFPSQRAALFMQKLKEKLQKHRADYWIPLLSNACRFSDSNMNVRVYLFNSILCR